jgi:hypothetical protein
MRRVRVVSAVLLTVLAACNRGARVPESIAGTWHVSSWAYPSAKVLVQAEVMRWLGQPARFAPGLATFADQRCEKAAYAESGTLPTIGEYAGITTLRPRARLAATIEVSCGGTPWVDPGRRLLVLDDGSLITEWQGRFFLLERTP